MSAATRGAAAALLLLCAALATPARAQQPRPDEEELFGGEDAPDAGVHAGPAGRPDEDAMFGGGEDAAEPDAGTRAAGLPDQPAGTEDATAAGAEGRRDEQSLGGPATVSKFATDAAVDDPLKLGGTFYLRGTVQGRDRIRLSRSPVSAPTLVDGYLDARPSDRLRGFVLARLTYDPTLASGEASALPGATTVTARENPAVLLDQAWLRFDIARKVFFTVGKQHVKWGVSRFWNPTDFLTPQRRDPLAQFDARTGASMVKLHVPWEAHGWNFYALALLDNAGPSNQVGRVGGAARAELVLGPAELGLSAVGQRGLKPRWGFDVSSGLGPVDVYAELALNRGTDAPLFRLPDDFDFSRVATDGIPVTEELPGGPAPQASGGLTYTFAYNDRDTVTVGAEYFYNSIGYTDRIAYPYLLFRGRFQPFYVARHYGAVYALLAGPGSWDDTSFVLSNLGNLTDKSYVSRLDVLHRAFNDLSVEAYVAAHYGTKGGEFRLGFEVPSFVVNGQPTPALDVRAPTLEAGLGLRISI